MSEQYGDDFITITDEDGQDYELEVLDELEYNGITYMVVCDANLDDDVQEIEYSILKVVEENGEEIIVSVDDEDELTAVDTLFDERWQAEEAEAE